MSCLRSLMTKRVAAATCKCRRRPLVPGGSSLHTVMMKALQKA